MGESALNEDVDALFRFLILFTAIAAVRAVVSAASAWFTGRFNAKAGYKLRENFVRYFLRVPFSSFEKVGSGESLSIFTNDVPRATNMLGGFGMFAMVTDFTFLIASMVLMFTINWVLTLILLGTIPVLVVIQVAASLPIQKRNVAMSEESANFNAVVNDSLQNVSTIAAYSLEDVMEDRYLASYDKYMASVKSFAKVLLPLISVGFVASGVPLSVVNLVAGISTINGNMSIAEFIAYSGVATITVSWMMMLSQRLTAVQEGIAGAVRLNDNTAESVEVLQDGQVKDSPIYSGGIMEVPISFKNVSFAYGEDMPLALEDVSFDIKPGSRVAFVGGSGSGKSTVLKMLMGIYTPASGEITVAGSNALEMPKNPLRMYFSYVPQDSFLFPESIGENITMGEVTTPQLLEKACADAGILDFINSLPNKFDSVLSESAENVSGGQRQRIAMARAFFKNSPVILFDEATSALDPTTEANILDSLNSAATGKTVIMVAHRTRAIAACDTIIVMDNGKVSGIGTHDQLIASNAIYQNLYERQCQKERGAD